MTKFFTMIFWLAISIALLSSATHPCHSESDTESAYEINDVGTIEKFGVKVEILPETDMFGVVGFQVSCTYDDPFFDDNPVAVLLFTKHYIAGRFGFDATAASPFIWSNARDTKFAIVVHPKVRTVDGQLIPYLDVRIYCNTAEREYAYIKAKKTGEYFAITPEGYETQELSTLGRTIEVSGEIFSLVSLTLTVIDTIFLT
ncbi:hypothetical protein KAR91_33345, partial [Candidatus Pacearchaeota archaeon]|nr:hypothetical protein [Candidatus Pacearchaeota archaeon]